MCKEPSPGKTMFFFGMQDYPLQDIVFRSKPKKEKRSTWGDSVPEINVSDLANPLAHDPLGSIVLKKVLSLPPASPERTPPREANHPLVNVKGLTPRTLRVHTFHKKEEKRALNGLKLFTTTPAPTGNNSQTASDMLSSRATSQASTVQNTPQNSPSRRASSGSKTHLSTSQPANDQEDDVQASPRPAAEQHEEATAPPRGQQQDASGVPVQEAAQNTASPTSQGEDACEAVAQNLVQKEDVEAVESSPSVSEQKTLKDVISQLRAQPKPVVNLPLSGWETEENQISSRLIRTKAREMERLEKSGKLASEHFSEGDSSPGAKALWKKVRAAVYSKSFFEGFEKELAGSQSMVEKFYKENSKYLPEPPREPTSPPSLPKEPRTRRRYGLQVPPAPPTVATPKHLRIKSLTAIAGSPQNKKNKPQAVKWYLPGIGQKTVEVDKGQFKRVLDEPPVNSSKRRASQCNVQDLADPAYARSPTEPPPKTPSARKTRLRALRTLTTDDREEDQRPMVVPRTPSPEPGHYENERSLPEVTSTNDTGRLKRKNGAWYEGEMSRGVFHGHGTFHFANGDVYTGQWHRGYRQGYGRSETQNGDGYEGEWRLGMQHGRGRHWCANGEEYDGEWRNNVAHGQGTFREASGVKWEGVWKEGEVEWQGRVRPGSRVSRNPSLEPECSLKALPVAKPPTAGQGRAGSVSPSRLQAPEMRAPPPMRRADSLPLLGNIRVI